MKRFARILYLLIGSVFPILIGALHTFVHFTDLTTPQVQETLSKSASIMGTDQALWNTWGVTSFMMGTSFIIIGALNLQLLKKYRENYPPTQGIIIMIAYLSCVVYVGIAFEAIAQLYGGIFGIVLAMLCWLLKVINQPKLKSSVD